METWELIVGVATIVGSVGSGVLAVKVDLAGLKKDVSWLVERFRILEKRIHTLETQD